MADPFHAEEYALSQAVPLSSLTYSNNGTRKQPINPQLAQTLQQAVTQVYGPDYRVDVMSGAQPAGPRGTPGTTGSRRHGTGDAADIWVYSPSGQRLQGDQLLPLSQHWLSTGIGSVGFPANGANSLHLDLIGGKGPGAIPLKSGEGKLWYYGQPTASQRQALNTSLSHPVPPGNIPQVATAYANTSAPTPASPSSALDAIRNIGVSAPPPLPMNAGTSLGFDPVMGGYTPIPKFDYKYDPATGAALPIDTTARDGYNAVPPAMRTAMAALPPMPSAPIPAPAIPTPSAPPPVPMSDQVNPRTGQQYTQQQWSQVLANRDHTNSSIATTGHAKPNPELARMVSGMVGSAAAPAINNATAAVTGTAQNVANSVGSAFGSLGGLFGGGKSSPPPVPSGPSFADVQAFQSQNSNWNGDDHSTPLSATLIPTSNGAGGGYNSVTSAQRTAMAALPNYGVGLVPPSGSGTSTMAMNKAPAAPAIMTYQQQINPAYSAWMNAPKAPAASPFSNPGVQGLSPDERQAINDAAKAPMQVPALPAPPKYITVKQPSVPVAPIPATLPPGLQKPDFLAPLYDQFSGSPLGHIAHAVNPSWGNRATPLAPGQSSWGGLLGMLGGLGHTSAPGAITAQLTPGVMAQQNPDALAALIRGSNSYTASGGGLVPTITTNGQVRQSYGDSSNGLGSSLSSRG